MRLTYSQTDDDTDVDVFSLDKAGRLVWIQDYVDQHDLGLEVIDIKHLRAHRPNVMKGVHEYRVTLRGSAEAIGEFIKGFPDTDSIRVD